MPSQKAFCISQHGRLAMILSLMSNVSFLLIPKTLALSPRNLFHVKAMMLSRLAESAWPGWIVSRNTTITIFFCLLLLLFFWPGWIVSRNTTISIFFCLLLLLLFWPGWIVSCNTTITTFFCCFATIHKPSPYMDVLLPPYNALQYYHSLLEKSSKSNSEMALELHHHNYHHL